MIDLPYGLIIEATSDPAYYSFYSRELEGFTGSAASIDACLLEAQHGMAEHVALLKEQGLPIPPRNPNPKVVVQNSALHPA